MTSHRLLTLPGEIGKILRWTYPSRPTWIDLFTVGCFMTGLKRIILFLAVNFLVIITLSLILSAFGVQPFLQHHGLNIQSLMIFCMVWGMGGALISLSLSRLMAKWIMGVRLVDEQTRDPQLRQLVAIVHKMTQQAQLSDIPQIGVFDSPEPNAFATGPTKRKSLIAVSSGLLQKMSPKEIEGVVAHEMAHIANGDMVTMTLLQGVVNAFVMFLARILAYALSNMGKNRNESSSSSYMSYNLFVILFEIVFMILGSLIVCAFSRWREFRADRGGAILAGRENMIAALESLQRMQAIRDPNTQSTALAALQISTRSKTGFLHWFATHPPLEARIERLKTL
jgi:heat shock protein HtpX